MNSKGESIFYFELKCNFIVFTRTITSATIACLNYRSLAFILAIALQGVFEKKNRIGFRTENFSSFLNHNWKFIYEFTGLYINPHPVGQ